MPVSQGWQDELFAVFFFEVTKVEKEWNSAQAHKSLERKEIYIGNFAQIIY